MTITRRAFLARSAAAAAGVAVAGWEWSEAEAAVRLPRAQLRALRAAAAGPVRAPGDIGYTAARVLFNRRFDAIEPPAVVRARDAADVQAVVKWANRFDVPLVARSGGNAYDGSSTSRTAVVVDVGGLDGVAVSNGLARIGPGARLANVYTRLAARGLTIPAGSCPNVALGGHALNGGFGLSGRALGLTLDRVRALDVVTADGKRKTVDATHDPDLFWALRGGGGGLAIVTRLHLAPAPNSAGSWFRVSWPAAQRAQALHAWDTFAPGAPAALTALLTLTATGAAAFGQFLGAEARLRQLVAPLGGTLTTGSATRLALNKRWAGCSEPTLAGCAHLPRTTFDASSIYVDRPLSSAARSAFVHAADTGATLICDAYGGKVADVASGATAFVHRDVRFSVQIVSYAPFGTARARVRTARARIARFGNGQAYQNYPDLDLRHARRKYYGANLARLDAIAAAMDPDNRFR